MIEVCCCVPWLLSAVTSLRLLSLVSSTAQCFAELPVRLESAVNPDTRYGCGAETAAATAKIVNRKKCECLIPFMRCHSRTAGGVAVFCRHHGASRAAAVGPPKQKVGVACIPAIFCWPLNSYRSSQGPATVMEDNYEKPNSSCVRL